MLLKRMLYGRCYSKPSDHFFQDYLWKAWQRKQDDAAESHTKRYFENSILHKAIPKLLINTDNSGGENWQEPPHLKTCDGCASKDSGCNDENIRCSFYKAKPDVVLPLLPNPYTDAELQLHITTRGDKQLQELTKQKFLLKYKNSPIESQAIVLYHKAEHIRKEYAHVSNGRGGYWTFPKDFEEWYVLEHLPKLTQNTNSRVE